MDARRLVASISLGATTATAIRAQCPDGTPPPCSTTRVVSAPHRADPPLNDQTWIVVPFNNVTRAPEVDWLRDATVNLLYLDLSQWRDIRVVDDGRVADLVRQVPEARALPLSLEGATAMARRAGAGRLVMGSFIKQGARTTLAAKVFDVRHSTLIRSAQQDLTVQDSLMPVFGRLAQGILNVAAPPGSHFLNAGTARVDAYQEYLAGIKALNKFDLIGAKPHFEQALKLDSTFALAHYKLGVVVGWESARDTTRKTHAAAADRLSGSLPSRERALLKAFNAFEQGRYGAACETYGTIIKSDSSDVEAQYGLGECSFHSATVVVAPGQPPVFQGSWNTAIRAFEKSIALDSTFHLAYQHIFDALLNASGRIGYDSRLCPDAPPGPASCMYRALLRRDHDTLALRPVLVTDTAALNAQTADFISSGARERNLQLALETAKAWVDAAPTESRALGILGSIYAQLADPARAEAAYARVGGRLTDTEASKVLVGRIEALMMLGRTDQVRRLADSAVASPDKRADAVPAQLATLVGRFGPLDTALPAGKDAIGAYQAAAIIRAAISGGDPIVTAVERAYVDTLRTMNRWNDTTPSRIATYRIALRMPRTWPPAAYPSPANHRGSVITAVARGDTARLRSETRWIDSVLQSRPVSISDSGDAVLLADAFLILHDSVAALRVVRRTLDSTWTRTSLSSTPAVNGLPIIIAWPRMALLRADLESAIGDKAAAREWYRHFLDLFAGADREFQPMLTRARQGLAAVGGR